MPFPKSCTFTEKAKIFPSEHESALNIVKKKLGEVIYKNRGLEVVKANFLRINGQHFESLPYSKE